MHFPTYHFVFKGTFKLKPSVAGPPVVNHNHHVAQRSQGVQAEILDSFKPIVHQLHLEKNKGNVNTATSSRALEIRGWGHRKLTFHLLIGLFYFCV